MKLEKIEKINFGSFRNFQWNSAITSFGPINILLGWNGSGKTILSRLLRSLENNSPVSGSQFKFKIDGTIYTEKSDLSIFKDLVRVFNDEYVDTVLGENKSFPHIFYVGPEAVDYSKEEQELNKKTKTLEDKKCLNQYDFISQSTAKIISRVTGINNFKKELSVGDYSRYNKADFEKMVENITQKLEDGKIDNVSFYIEKDIRALQNQLLNGATTRDIIELIQSSVTWLNENYDDINSCLQAAPQQEVSKRISELSSEQKEWVEKGVGIHFSNEEHFEKCLFCNSEIENKNELLKHFSSEIVKLTDKIMIFVGEAKYRKTKLEGYQDRANNQQRESISRLVGIFDEIIRKLQEKKGLITEKQDLLSRFDQGDPPEDPSSSDTNAIAHRIEHHYVAEQYDTYLKLKKEYKTCLAERKNFEEAIRKIKQRIQVLQSQAKNTHEAAEKLNEIFKVAFPYRKIEITDNEDNTGYILKRDGVECPFSELSEGERNLIALAYFIASLNDERRNFSSEGIVVIDDPVSSLDKNSIFQIFALIARESEEHTERQYFLLTHNLDFFGHLREHYRNKIDNGNCPLYNVELDDSGSHIKNIHKLLKNYRSDYYYVFSVLNEHKDSCDLEDAYLVINLLRRWLETFIEFKFVSSGDFRSQINSAYRKTKEMDATFVADSNEMYRFLNHASHGFSDTEVTDESLLNGASQRIQDAFQLVKVLDSLHYEKLNRLV